MQPSNHCDTRGPFYSGPRYQLIVACGDRPALAGGRLPGCVADGGLTEQAIAAHADPAPLVETARLLGYGERTPWRIADLVVDGDLIRSDAYQELVAAGAQLVGSQAWRLTAVARLMKELAPRPLCFSAAGEKCQVRLHLPAANSSSYAVSAAGPLAERLQIQIHYGHWVDSLPLAQYVNKAGACLRSKFEAEHPDLAQGYRLWRRASRDQSLADSLLGELMAQGGHVLSELRRLDATPTTQSLDPAAPDWPGFLAVLSQAMPAGKPVRALLGAARDQPERCRQLAGELLAGRTSQHLALCRRSRSSTNTDFLRAVATYLPELPAGERNRLASRLAERYPCSCAPLQDWLQQQAAGNAPPPIHWPNQDQDRHVLRQGAFNSSGWLRPQELAGAVASIHGPPAVLARVGELLCPDRWLVEESYADRAAALAPRLEQTAAELARTAGSPAWQLEELNRRLAAIPEVRLPFGDGPACWWLSLTEPRACWGLDSEELCGIATVTLTGPAGQPTYRFPVELEYSYLGLDEYAPLARKAYSDWHDRRRTEIASLSEFIAVGLQFAAANFERELADCQARAAQAARQRRSAKSRKEQADARERS